MIKIVTEFINMGITNLQIIEVIKSILFSGILSFLHLKILEEMFQIKRVKWQGTKFLVIFSLFQIICKIIFKEIQCYFLIMCCLPIFLYYFLDVSFYQILKFNCILGICGSITILMSQILFMFKVIQCKSLNMQEIEIVCLIVLESLILLYAFFQKKEKVSIEEIKKNQRIRYLILFIVLYVVQVFQIYMLKENKSLLLYCYYMSIDIIYFYILLNMLKKELQQAKKTEEAETLKMYNKTLELCTSSVKKFENDFNNIIQDIGGYIKYDDLESLRAYYYGVMEEYNDVKRLAVLNPTLINEFAIYNIISNKYYLAKSYSIEIEVEVMLDFTKLKMKPYELARILGILLDNAIEATKECFNKQIRILFLQGKNRDVIKISNTYHEDKLDITKIFEKGFSTKEKNQGLGLWEVKQILNKHSNLDLYTYKENNVFWQELSIYDEK